ncbi:MAG TPA: hypothetical protein PKA59_07950 [Chakrabartia sp.]|nr:hypothetical protein [Chakrabartia sp.]
MPGAAQLSFSVGKKKKKVEDAACAAAAPKKKGDAGKKILGAVAGAAAGAALGRVTGARFMPVFQFRTSLTPDIACRLDPKEQEKAATATNEVVRGEKVGDSVKWESETRPGVSGTTTIATLEAPAGKASCIMVSDVIIVDGEETRAEKKMCRIPPSPRFAIANA